MLRSTGARVVAVFVLILAVFLLFQGIVNLRDSLGNATRVDRTLAQLLKEDPQHGWYHVTGCRLDFGRAVIELANNIPTRAYVPVFDAGNPRERTTHFFAMMDDPKTLRLFLDMQEQSRFHSAKEQAEWFQNHATSLVEQRDVSGLLSRGIYRPTQPLNEKFAEIADTDSNQFLILAEGWKSNPGRGYAFLWAGLAGLVFVGAVIAAGRPQR